MQDPLKMDKETLRKKMDTLNQNMITGEMEVLDKKKKVIATIDPYRMFDAWVENPNYDEFELG
jgi:hypothetical protein